MGLWEQGPFREGGQMDEEVCLKFKVVREGVFVNVWEDVHNVILNGKKSA